LNYKIIVLKDIKQNIILESLSIKDALIRLNDLGTDLTLFVVNADNVVLGTVTDGDIRRNLILDVSINANIKTCMYKDFKFLREGNITIEEVKKLKDSSVTIVPIIDDYGKILRIINIKNSFSILPLDAIIMAGGRGERLRPLTDTVPKPLLQVGGMPIIERNIDRLKQFGINNITIALKYLGNQISDYFKSGDSKQINISYVDELIPLGTIGAIKLVDKFVHDDILVMNSDLLTNVDFEQMYLLYKESNADMIIASTSYDVNIPYAVLETENGQIKSFKEKPTYSYHSNAGIYIIKKEVIGIIPEGTFYNATDLIDDLIKAGKKVVHFPIMGYWLDIGKHEDFEKAQRDVGKIKF